MRHFVFQLLDGALPHKLICAYSTSLWKLYSCNSSEQNSWVELCQKELFVPLTCFPLTSPWWSAGLHWYLRTGNWGDIGLILMFPPTCQVQAMGASWKAFVCLCARGGISKGRSEEGKYTVHTQVSLDLEGATEVLSTSRHPRHLAFSHDAGPLLLSTSTCVWSPVFTALPAWKESTRGDPTLFIDASWVSTCW